MLTTNPCFTPLFCEKMAVYQDGTKIYFHKKQWNRYGLAYWNAASQATLNRK
jgi:hypothetical protein